MLYSFLKRCIFTFHIIPMGRSCLSRFRLLVKQMNCHLIENVETTPSEDNVQNADMQTEDEQEPMEVMYDGGVDGSKMGWGLN